MPSVVGTSECEPTRLVLRVLRVLAHDEGIVEEDLFTFRIRNDMLLEVLVCVAFVPLEANAPGELFANSPTSLYMAPIYNETKA